MKKAPVIDVNFDTLRSNYPTYNKLPRPIQEYMDRLNKNIKPGEPRSTPCCIQVSHALNMAGHTIPERSHRRANAQIPGGAGYYVQAVDELELYLAATYGRGEEIKTKDIAQAKDAIPRMKKRLDGRRGILVFRNSGAGFHTELWDQTHIIQNGAPTANGAAMSETGIFGQPRVVFWPVGEDDSADVALHSLPGWLYGWWQVDDGITYYYYFSQHYVVSYTKTKPKNVAAPAISLPLNEGRVSLQKNATVVVIDWNPADGGQTRETFTCAPGSTSFMRGVSNRYGPLTAVKM